MKNHTLYLVLLFLASLTLAGCEKDPGPDPVPQGQACYLSNIQTQPPGSPGWIITEEVITDAGHRIIRANLYSSFVPGVLESYTTFSYNSAGRLEKTEEFRADGTPKRYFTYEHNAQGQLSRQDEYDYDETAGTFGHVNHWLMEYNAANQLVKRINHQGGLNSFGTFEYNADGNVIREAYFYPPGPGEPPVAGDSFEYEYDNKKAFHTGYSTLKFNAFSLSRNNITKSTAKDASGTVQPDESFTNTYTYNTRGYPTEVTSASFFDPGTSFNARFEYDCE